MPACGPSSPNNVNDRPSYLAAFLRHPYNRVALLAAGCAAVFASIPLGWTGLALVAVVALGTEVLAALAIPGLPSFRAWAEREHHHKGRSLRRERLLSELANLGGSDALASYQHMRNRVLALYQSADDSRTSLTRQDVDKLEDLTVDYLGLSAINLSLKQRKDHANEDLVLKRIAGLQSQLKNSALAEDEERQLRAALAQYTEAMQRSRRLAVRRSALEATLMAMPDKMEEVYQLVITSPYSTDMGGKLEESLSRLRIAEDVAAEFDASDSTDFKSQSQPYAQPNAFGKAAQKASRALKA